MIVADIISILQTFEPTAECIFPDNSPITDIIPTDSGLVFTDSVDEDNEEHW